VDPKAVMIIGEDFTPYELTPTEQRESLRRLIRWVAHRDAMDRAGSSERSPQAP
jgi:hypothetical protein